MMMLGLALSFQANFKCTILNKAENLKPYYGRVLLTSGKGGLIRIMAYEQEKINSPGFEIAYEFSGEEIKKKIDGKERILQKSGFAPMRYKKIVESSDGRYIQLKKYPVVFRKFDHFYDHGWIASDWIKQELFNGENADIAFHNAKPFKTENFANRLRIYMNTISHGKYDLIFKDFERMESSKRVETYNTFFVGANIIMFLVMIMLMAIGLKDSTEAKTLLTKTVVDISHIYFLVYLLIVVRFWKIGPISIISGGGSNLMLCIGLLVMRCNYPDESKNEKKFKNLAFFSTVGLIIIIFLLKIDYFGWIAVFSGNIYQAIVIYNSKNSEKKNKSPIFSDFIVPSLHQIPLFVFFFTQSTPHFYPNRPTKGKTVLFTMMIIAVYFLILHFNEKFSISQEDCYAKKISKVKGEIKALEKRKNEGNFKKRDFDRLVSLKKEKVKLLSSRKKKLEELMKKYEPPAPKNEKKNLVAKKRKTEDDSVVTSRNIKNT